MGLLSVLTRIQLNTPIKSILFSQQTNIKTVRAGEEEQNLHETEDSSAV